MRRGDEKEVKVAAAAALPVDPIWGSGLSFLIAKGTKVSHARTFLGKMVRAYGVVLLQQALERAEHDDVVEPRAWLQKALPSMKARYTVSDSMPGIRFEN